MLKLNVPHHIFAADQHFKPVRSYPHMRNASSTLRKIMLEAYRNGRHAYSQKRAGFLSY